MKSNLNLTIMPSSKIVLFNAITATFTLFSVEVQSFTVFINTSTSVKQYSRPSPTSSRPRTSLKRPATIIDWNDESSSYTSSFDEPSHDVFGGYDSTSYTYTSIANSISQSTDKTSSLARLAAAFSPPDQSIKLEDITQIQVIQVSNTHIDLSAVVCDESQCVTILVPVSFQHDCDGSCDSEACVLNNIDKLDVVAQRVLNQRSFGNSEEGEELLRALNDSSNIQYPSWWIAPQSYEMVAESQQIANTLNQDGFRSEIQALAKKGLEMTQDGHLFDIKRAVVCSIGPAGFYFRAIAIQKHGSLSNSHLLDDDTSSYTLLEIPFPFSEQQKSRINDPVSLRSTVLEAASSIKSE